jgi:hypothetical protein
MVERGGVVLLFHHPALVHEDPAVAPIATPPLPHTELRKLPAFPLIIHDFHNAYAGNPIAAPACLAAWRGDHR